MRRTVATCFVLIACAGGACGKDQSTDNGAGGRPAEDAGLSSTPAPDDDASSTGGTSTPSGDDEEPPLQGDPQNPLGPGVGDDEDPTDARPDFDPLDCPASLPSEGTSCAGYVLCTYGSSESFECRTFRECIGGVWQTPQTHCVTEACPLLRPSKSESCVLTGNSETNAGACVYSGEFCYCTLCPNGVCQDQPTWDCRAPTAKGCPDIQPNLGDSCEDQGKSCVYGDPCRGGGRVTS